jgi:hypothetical protein
VSQRSNPEISLPELTKASKKRRESPKEPIPAAKQKVESRLYNQYRTVTEARRLCFRFRPYHEEWKKKKNLKRPRTNDLLDANTVGAVQIVVGGMHCVALTKDQKILTWSVNDNGALGCDTAWEATTRDIDADSDSEGDEEEDIFLNHKESTPTAIPTEFFGEDLRVFVQVVATDSASFAITDNDSVYGCGTLCVSFIANTVHYSLLTALGKRWYYWIFH